MIDIQFSGNVATLTPTGSLTARDVAQLSEAMDDYINRTDQVPNLVVHARQFPRWQGLHALNQHLQFVRKHQRIVKKVAVVSDTLALKAFPMVMDQLVAAKVRRFSEAKLDEAKAWAAAGDDHPGEFELLDGFPADVVAIRAKGIITSQDYRDVLNPLVAEKLKRHDRLKVLFILDADFESYSEGAVLDDVRFGFRHMSDFAKIALVTDLGWMRSATRLFAPLIKGEIKLYHCAELEEAKAWIVT
jgi:hypothetical protein